MSDLKVDLGLLCQVVGRKLGVTIREDKYIRTFATNGKEVIIPTGIAGGEMDADILRGGIAHEAAGHVRHTDFDLLNAWCHDKSALAKGLQNIIEDPRIEMAAIRVYPGCRGMLHKMVAALEARGFFKIPDQDGHPASVLGAYLIRALRTKLLDQPLAMDEITALAKEVFGEEMLQKILDIALAGAKGDSTADVLKATEAILDLLKESAPEQEKAPQEQGGQDGDGEAGDSESQSSNGNQGNKDDQEGSGSQGGESHQDDEGTEGDSESQGGENRQGDEAAQEGSGGQGSESNQGEEGDQEKAGKEGSGGQGGSQGQGDPVLRDVLNAAEWQIGPTDLAEILGNAIKNMRPLYDQSVTMNRYESRSPANYAACALGTSLGTRLRGQMEVLLQSRVEDEDPDQEEYGRLDPRMLTRSCLMDRRVFTTEGEEAEGLSTAVQILVDHSGSMRDFGKGNVALATVYALASAMAPYETQGVKFAIAGFDSSVIDLKLFRDSWIQAKKWIGNYSPRGGTRMTGAMRLVLPELAARKEARKSLVVITDGDVGDESTNREIMRFAKAEKVDVDVLVIGDEPVTNNHGFRTVVNVRDNDPKAIQAAIFKLLSKAV